MDTQRKIEKLAVILKSENGTCHDVLLSEDQMVCIAVFVSSLFEGNIPASKEEITEVSEIKF